MPIVSHGIPDGGQLQRPNHRTKVLELIKSDKLTDEFALPFAYSGLSIGSGDAGEYPAALYDGLILSRSKVSDVFSADEMESLGYGVTRSQDFFDFAATAVDGPLYMAFANNTVGVTGSDNHLFTYNTGVDPYAGTFNAGPPMTPVISPDWEAGRFASNCVTGLFGVFKCWIADIHTNELDLAGYTEGVAITVEKGRFKLVGGDGATKPTVGKVERIFTSGTFSKVLLHVDLTNPHLS